jgi:acyl dehydratase
VDNLLKSDLVGSQITPAQTHITARRLMGYAAALGATEDVYLNDLRPGGIVGLPSFVIAPEWQVMNGAPYRALLGADNTQMWRCIHVQQASTVFRPLRSDTHVTTRGTICELRQTRIGAYIAVRLDMTEDATQEPLAQSWFCGIFLGDQIEGPDRSIAKPPAPVDAPSPLTKNAEPFLEVSRALPHLYTEAAQIWNPIHTERSAARNAGLEETLLHGSCSWGAAGLQIVRQFADGDPARMTHLGARMTGKALVGSALYLHHHVIDAEDGARQVSFEVVNERGDSILANGRADIAA